MHALDTDDAVVNQKASSSDQPLRQNKKLAQQMCYSISSIMATWNATTEYGLSFRNMNEEEKEAEVKRLNIVALKGQKDTVKSKLLSVKYKALIAERMRAHLTDSRLPLTSIYHVVIKSKSAVFNNPNFLSVGEWVEVDADRTPGFNSEGGIAVIIGVQDNCADVKYVILTIVLQ